MWREEFVAKWGGEMCVTLEASGDLHAPRPAIRVVLLDGLTRLEIYFLPANHLIG